jgi:Fe-S cluster assembly protein SufD
MNTVSTSNDLQTFADYFESGFQILPNTLNIEFKRKSAFKKFIELGFPNKSNEEYKYSTTEKIFKEELNILEQSNDIEKIDFNAIRSTNAEAYHLFLFNGNLILEQSDLHNDFKDCIVCDLKTAVSTHANLIEKYYAINVENFNDAFAQLNVAMASKGLFIYIPTNVKVNKPIQINNISFATQYSLIQTHHIIVAESNSSLSIIETYISKDNISSYLLNTVSEIFVGENASVNYYKLHNENDLAAQINATQVTQLQNSHFDTNTVVLGGKWLRNNLNISLKGTNTQAHLNGLQISQKQQHIDNHTLVDHQVPFCESNQIYKGILKDKSTGVFNGKIFVRKDAQKTNAYQSSKNMLLSDDATMNTKPQLEIFADDVKCSHGSSTGQIDESALFYLRARGLSPSSAKSLLMFAFATDVLQTIKLEQYKNYLTGLIADKFN